MLQLLPAPLVFGGLAALVATASDWRGGVMLMFAFGVSAGWRRWPQRAAAFGALAYVVLGVAATALRARGLPPGAVLSPALGALVLAFLGHAVGLVARNTREAAFAVGKAAAAQIVGSISLASAAPASRPASRFPSSRGPAETAAPGRPHAAAMLPKSWTPTVSPRRRGLFS